MNEERKEQWSLETLDSTALYRLAQEKERQEQEVREAERRVHLEELRGMRKEILDRHKRELAEIDRELRQYSTKTIETASPRKSIRRRKGGVSIGETLCSIIGTRTEMPIAELREQAVAMGISHNSITQMLAYLKRVGRLTTPRRGVYAVVR